MTRATPLRPLSRAAPARLLALALLLAALFAALAGPAFAQVPTRKLALVIGNAEYEGNILENPEHDAAAVGERLRALGFKVTTGLNLGRAGMGSLIAQFVDGVGDNDLVLIFYAGHGVEVGGQTYLIPVDARMLSPSAPKFEGLPVEQLWSFAHRPYGTVILFDACRDSPFLSRVRGDVAGAHAASTPPNTLVLFSSPAGRAASDGTGAGKDSVFTTALLQALDKPDTSLDEVVRTTTRAVRASTSDGQIPQRYGGLDQDFAFATRTLAMAAAPVREEPLPAPAAAPPPIQVATAGSVPQPTPTRSLAVDAPAPSAAPAPPPAPAAVAQAAPPTAPQTAPVGAMTVAMNAAQPAWHDRPAPPPPVLRGLKFEDIADVTPPKSFCSLEEKYAFIANRQKPAGEAAMRNNAAAIAYKAELNAMYIKYRDATASGMYSGEVMAELTKVGVQADEAFAKAGQMQKMFDVVMAVPVAAGCKT